MVKTDATDANEKSEARFDGDRFSSFCSFFFLSLLFLVTLFFFSVV